MATIALILSAIATDSGPLFTFPPDLVETGAVVTITAFTQLERHLRGWTADEIPY